MIYNQYRLEAEDSLSYCWNAIVEFSRLSVVKYNIYYL